MSTPSRALAVILCSNRSARCSRPSTTSSPTPSSSSPSTALLLSSSEDEGAGRGSSARCEASAAPASEDGEDPPSPTAAVACPIATLRASRRSSSLHNKETRFVGVEGCVCVGGW